MTFSGNKRASFMCDAIWMYWRLSSDARRAPDKRVGIDTLEEIRDEAEVLADHCDWPRMRAAILANAALTVPKPVAVRPLG